MKVDAAKQDASLAEKRRSGEESNSPFGPRPATSASSAFPRAETGATVKGDSTTLGSSAQENRRRVEKNNSPSSKGPMGLAPGSAISRVEPNRSAEQSISPSSQWHAGLSVGSELSKVAEATTRRSETT